jgi:hypothetical protein
MREVCYFTAAELVAAVDQAELRGLHPVPDLVRRPEHALDAAQRLHEAAHPLGSVYIESCRERPCQTLVERLSA